MDKLDFSFEADPTTVGMSPAGVDRIVSIFEQHFAEGLNIGAQLVVARHGRVVVDRAIGLRRLGTTETVQNTTPFLLFSCTKSLTSMCVHKLAEEGKVDLDAPIADYWPEYGTKGKETGTVAHALLHQTGIPGRGLYPQIPRWWYWDWVTSSVADLEVEHEPGSKTAYHLVNNGFILGEIVRRVTNVMIDEYMQREFLDPLGMADSYLGIPTDQLARASEVYWSAADQRAPALLFRYARQAVIPAATLNAPARDLARFYQMMINGGEYNGRPILKKETIDYATKIHYTGLDETLGEPDRWGMGFGIGGPQLEDQRIYGNTYGRYSTHNTFGHGGQRSSIGWGDKSENLVIAFTTNNMIDDVGSTKRQQDIGDAVWEALTDHQNPRLG